MKRFNKWLVEKWYEYKDPNCYSSIDDWLIPIMFILGIGLFIWAIVIPYWGYLWR